MVLVNQFTAVFHTGSRVSAIILWHIDIANTYINNIFLHIADKNNNDNIIPIAKQNNTSNIKTTTKIKNF
jgi:hypothetical protein